MHVVPLNTAPTPAPISAPPSRKKARSRSKAPPKQYMIACASSYDTGSKSFRSKGSHHEHSIAIVAGAGSGLGRPPPWRSIAPG